MSECSNKTALCSKVLPAKSLPGAQKCYLNLKYRIAFLCYWQIMTLNVMCQIRNRKVDLLQAHRFSPASLEMVIRSPVLAE